MAAAATDEAVMKAVLEQMANSDFKLDWEKLAATTGAPTPNAARVRWGRLKEKLIGSASDASTSSKPTGVTKRAAKPTSARKPRAPKSKKGGEEVGDGTNGDSVTPKPARKRATPAKKAPAQAAEEMNVGGGSPAALSGNPAIYNQFYLTEPMEEDKENSINEY